MSQSQSTKEIAPKKKKEGKGLFLVLLVAIGIAGTLGILGWKMALDLLAIKVRYFERNAPRIEVVESARGVGLAPASFRFLISDVGYGLDEVVVRTIQRNVPHQIRRDSLNGELRAELPLVLRQDKSELEEGSAVLEVKAFDRSFWNNSAEISLPIKVDFRKPKIEVVSSQHNAVQGGSQLLFYKAFDEHLAVSGVKVGSSSFLGFLARGLDKVFSDKSLFVVLYAIPFNEDPKDLQLKVFAEDDVGNGSSNSQFYYKNTARSHREVTVKLTEEYLRGTIGPIFEQNFVKLQRNASAIGSDLRLSSAKGTPARLIEQFQIVNERLREIDNTEIISLVQNPRFDKLWEEPFVQQPGTITGAFGDAITYTFEGQAISKTSRAGYEFTLATENRDVIAQNSGIVMFVETLGPYGRTVAIDHGLGLVSLYGLMDSVSVKKGDPVGKGQSIGLATMPEGAHNAKLYFELRIGGTPVDAREWWDRQWLYSHITAKINEVKRSFGIPVYKPLE